MSFKAQKGILLFEIDVMAAYIIKCTHDTALKEGPE